MKDYGRFSGYGDTPPEKNGAFAWLLHILKSLKSTGKAAVILPHGVLFRGNAEATIRKAIIDKGYIKGIIGLPANLFYGAGIPACILIFRKDRGTNNKVLFIDASGDGRYEKDKNQNKLRECDVKKIVDTYVQYKTDIHYADEPKFSHVATLEEIAENDYNLNIPRYVDTYEEEAEIDIVAVQQEIDALETELAEVQAKMKEYLKELGM